MIKDDRFRPNQPQRSIPRRSISLSPRMAKSGWQFKGHWWPWWQFKGHWWPWWHDLNCGACVFCKRQSVKALCHQNVSCLTPRAEEEYWRWKKKKRREKKVEKAGIDLAAAAPSQPDRLDGSRSDHSAGSKELASNSWRALRQRFGLIDTLNGGGKREKEGKENDRERAARTNWLSHSIHSLCFMCQSLHPFLRVSPVCLFFFSIPGNRAC